MKKYRFKTEAEFKADGRWDSHYNTPDNWDSDGDMNGYMGKDVPEEFEEEIEDECSFEIYDEEQGYTWSFDPEDVILKSNNEIISPIFEVEI